MRAKMKFMEAGGIGVGVEGGDKSGALVSNQGLIFRVGS